MEYVLLADHEAIRTEFVRRFVMSYGAYCHRYAEQIQHLRMDHRRNFTQEYYQRLFLSDRLILGFRESSFADALSALRAVEGDVLFLTNGPECLGRDYAVLGTEKRWAARADACALADALEAEWFHNFELWDQGMYDPEPLLPSEIYAFTPDFASVFIFTHETDETERPETRVCLLYGNKQP